MAKQTLQSTDNGADSMDIINENFTEVYTGANINAATGKTTPVDADAIGLIDSAASYVLKKLSFLNLKVAIGSFLNPIGTIREFNVSTNPNTLLGFGTWSAYGTGRVTVAIDAGQTEFDTVDETGGEKTHLLTANESGLRQHAHGQRIAQTAGSGAYDQPDPATARASSPIDNLGFNTGDVSSASAITAHNNLQPYIVVYRWVRVS